MTDVPYENDDSAENQTQENEDANSQEQSFDDKVVDFGDLDVQDESADQPVEVEETPEMKLQAASDRMLRMQAELDNVRKRNAREMDTQRRYAAMPLLRDLLPVLDNMYRAIEAAEKSEDASGLLDGFKMVVTLMTDSLSRHNCTKIEALHQPFDPHLHEAVQQQPTDEFPPGTVLIELQTGYKLHDRIVRPSQVIVSTAPPKPAAEEADAE